MDKGASSDSSLNLDWFLDFTFRTAYTDSTATIAMASSAPTTFAAIDKDPDPPSCDIFAFCGASVLLLGLSVWCTSGFRSFGMSVVVAGPCTLGLVDRVPAGDTLVVVSIAVAFETFSVLADWYRGVLTFPATVDDGGFDTRIAVEDIPLVVCISVVDTLTVLAGGTVPGRSDVRVIDVGGGFLVVDLGLRKYLAVVVVATAVVVGAVCLVALVVFLEAGATTGIGRPCDVLVAGDAVVAVDGVYFLLVVVCGCAVVPDGVVGRCAVITTFGVVVCGLAVDVVSGPLLAAVAA